MPEESYNDRMWERISSGITYYDQELEPKYRRWQGIYRSDTGSMGASINPDDALRMNLSIGDMAEMRRYYFARLNLGTSFINIKTSALTVKEPTFSATILDESQYDPAKVLLIQSSMRRIWRESGAQEAIREADTYRRVYGYSLIKPSWDRVFNAKGDIMTQRGKATAIPPTRLFYDTSADRPDMGSLRWLAELVWMDKDSLDAMRQAGWKNTKKVGRHGRLETLTTALPTGASSGDESHGRASVGAEEHKKNSEVLYPVFLMWDFTRRKYTVLAPRGEQDGLAAKENEYVVLYEENDPYPYEDFFPHVMLTGLHVPNQFHPQGDIALMEPHLDLLARLFTVFVAHSIRSVPKFAYAENTMTEQGRRALTEPSVMAGVEMRSNAPVNSVVPLPSAPVPDALIAGIGKAEQYLNEAAAILDYHRGSAPAGRHTMGEVSQLVSLSGVRGQMELRQLEETMGKLAGKLYDLYRFENSTVTIVQEMAPGMRQPIQVPMDSLPSSIELLVNSGSSAFSDRVQDRNDMMNLFQLVTQVPLVPPQSLPVMKHILQTFPQLSASDVIDILRAYMQAAQMQQQQAQAEAEGCLLYTSPSPRDS